MNVTHSSDDLLRFIQAAGENDYIDAKRAMSWDGGEASAGLAKDIIAFANSRDGGVIVIGKEEVEPGKFEMAGVSAEQAASFETTKVSNWINSRVAPPIRLTCYRQEHDGATFIIIAVAEFDDVPVLCTKNFELPGEGKKPKLLLKHGAIYVRTANAESAPIQSIWPAPIFCTRGYESMGWGTGNASCLRVCCWSAGVAGAEAAHAAACSEPSRAANWAGVW